MTRRSLLFTVALVLLLSEFVVLVQPVHAAGSVAVVAWSCTPAVDANATDQVAFTAACPTEATELTFGLTAGGITRRRATAAGKPASWPAVTGAFTLAIDDPKGEPAVAFCRRNNGAAERFPAPAGEISGDLAADTALTCDWYRLAAPAAPTATQQPTSTPQSPPTATQMPTVAVSPTVTQFPTATQIPTQAATATVAATPTPTQISLPEPIDSGPPEMFRGDAAHTGRQAEPGPEGDPVLLWRYPIGARPVSSPVWAAGVIYIGSDTGVFAIDAKNGSVRWQFPTERPVTATPAVVGGVVYVGGEDRNFYAIDAGTGIERWRFETGGKIRSSPAVDDGAIYFSSFDGSVYSLDAATGEERWVVVNYGDDMTSSPAVANGVVYIGLGDLDGGQLSALNAETGEQLWRYRTPDAIASSATVIGDVVYFGGDDGYLHAVDIETGERQCRYFTEKIIRSSPAALDGVIVTSNRVRTLFALNASTCDVLWTFDGAGDWIDSSPAVSGSTIYFGSKDDSFYALNAGTGEQRWSFPTQGSITTSPVVAAGVVYFASRDGFLYAIAGADNEGDLVPPPAEDAARPADIPAELLIDGARYRYDRVVPLDREGLERIAAISETDIFAAEDRDEASPIYTSRPSPDEDTSLLVRYLPERLGVEQVACLADGATDFGQIADGDDGPTYIFAGPELNLTPDQLTEATSDPTLGSIYTDDQDTNREELFITASGEFQRFALLDGDGLPRVLRGPFPFAGQVFAFTGDVTGDVAEGDLQRIGCAGPFAVSASPDEVASSTTPSFSRIYAVIADRVLAFDVVEPAGSDE